MGLTQREVAKMLGVSPGLVGNWSSGHALPSYQNVLKLIEIGMRADELFGKELARKLYENDQVKAIPAPTIDDLKSVIREVLAEDSADVVSKD